MRILNILLSRENTDSVGNHIRFNNIGNGYCLWTRDCNIDVSGTISLTAVHMAAGRSRRKLFGNMCARYHDRTTGKHQFSTHPKKGNDSEYILADYRTSLAPKRGCMVC